MQLVYQVYYFPRDYRPYLVTRKQPYMDIRHIVRTLLAQAHNAGPAEVARAETMIGQPGHSITHASISNSFTITRETIQPFQPLLVKRLHKLITETRPVRHEVEAKEKKN